VIHAARHWSGERIAAVGAAVAVFLAIGAGLFVLGPPSDIRARRLDAQRVDHLRQWARAIDAYWADNAQLPASLDEVRRQQAWTQLPVADPVGRAYEYVRTGVVTYDLCGTFDRAWAPASPSGEESIWTHGAGRACFALEARAQR